MWVLAFGALVPFGIVGADTARTVYTVFTGFSAAIAISLVTGRISQQK